MSTLCTVFCSMRALFNCDLTCNLQLIPAGSQAPTSWGQKACLSFALPAAWDKPLPARTAGELAGWRAGWRTAAPGSPVLDQTIKSHRVKSRTTLFCSVVFSIFSVETYCFVQCSTCSRLVFLCLSCSACPRYAEEWKIDLCD